MQVSAYRRQKAGTHRITMVYSSKRPASIAKEKMIFAQCGKNEKSPPLPTLPNAAPILPTSVSAAVMPVMRSAPVKAAAKNVTSKHTKYTNINPATLYTTSFRPGRRFSWMLNTPCGCKRRCISLSACFRRITQRITLMPPAVEPEQPPVNISSKRSAWANAGHAQ